MKFIPVLIGLPALLWFAHETSAQAALAVYIVMAANNLGRDLSNEKEQGK